VAANNAARLGAPMSAATNARTRLAITRIHAASRDKTYRIAPRQQAALQQQVAAACCKQASLSDPLLERNAPPYAGLQLRGVPAAKERSAEGDVNFGNFEHIV